MRGAAASLLLLAACNQVFEIAQTQLIDAAPPVDAVVIDASPDRDNDGVPNEADICPDHADPMQNDEDGDVLGDACDPCPLDANTAGDGDGDGIDDRCDPNDGIADCLILFDSFTAYQASDWNTVPGTTVTPSNGRIVLGGTPRGGISPKSLVGAHSLRVKFSAPQFDAGTDHLRLMGMASPSNSDAGFQCRISEVDLAVVDVTSSVMTTALSPSLGATETFVAAMSHDTNPPPTFRCAVDRTAGAVFTGGLVQQSSGGNVLYVLAVGCAVTVQSVSVYALRTAASCPQPIVR